MFPPVLVTPGEADERSVGSLGVFPAALTGAPQEQQKFVVLLTGLAQLGQSKILGTRSASAAASAAAAFKRSSFSCALTSSHSASSLLC